MRLKGIVEAGKFPAGPEEADETKIGKADGTETKEAGAAGTDGAVRRESREMGTTSAEEEISGGAREVLERDLVTPYLNMLKEKIQLGPRRLTVAVDCGNG